ncbi:MAG: cache domain-containing protein, partial [Halopseudomonas sp.]
MKIKTKLILFILTISMLPLTALALFSFLSAKQGMSGLISDELVTTVDTESKQLENRLAGALNDLSSWTLQPIFQDLLTDDEDGEVQLTLQRLQQQYPLFRSLSALNESGVVVASSDEAFVGANWAGTLIYQRSLESRPSQGQISTSSPIVMPVSIPVVADYDAEVIIGTLAGELDWSVIQQWLATISLAGAPQDGAHRLLLTAPNGQRTLYDSLEAIGTTAQASLPIPQQRGISQLQTGGLNYLVGTSHTKG